jgi:hypothetical protein
MNPTPVCSTGAATCLAGHFSSKDTEIVIPTRTPVEFWRQKKPEFMLYRRRRLRRPPVHCATRGPRGPINLLKHWRVLSMNLEEAMDTVIEHSALSMVSTTRARKYVVHTLNTSSVLAIAQLPLGRGLMQT